MRVLFLCTHNAVRSQMAEALLRWLTGGQMEVYSAGTEPTQPHPLAIQVLAELGIDWRQAESKSLDRYRNQSFDWVITLCDDAAEACPVFPGTSQRAHWPFPDPSKVTGSDAERLAAFRTTRDAIIVQLRAWLAEVAPAVSLRSC